MRLASATGARDGTKPRQQPIRLQLIRRKALAPPKHHLYLTCLSSSPWHNHFSVPFLHILTDRSVRDPVRLAVVAPEAPVVQFAVARTLHAAGLEAATITVGTIADPAHL